MSNDYSADLSGLRDELISGLRELRKEVQQEGKKINEAINDIAKDVDIEPIKINVDSRDARKELKDLDRQLNAFARKIKNNLSRMSVNDMREVLSLISKLKDVEGYADKIQDTFGNITASFYNAGDVVGLQAVVDEFKNSAQQLSGVNWGFGKRYERAKLIEDQKVIIDQLKQIGRLQYAESRSQSGIDIFATGFTSEDFASRFTPEELRTRLDLLQQLNENIQAYVKLTKATKIELAGEDVYQPNNIAYALNKAISDAKANLPAIEDYDIPSVDEIWQKFTEHVDNTIDRRSMSDRLRKDFKYYAEAITSGRCALQEAIDGFAKDINVDTMYAAWEELTDGLDVPQGLMSMPKDYAVQIRNGALEVGDAISYMRGAIDGLQTTIVDDDDLDLDHLFESENLRHYNDLIEECTNFTGELSDAVAKHAKIQREMVSIWRSGNIVPKELIEAREQIEQVISGYFKKDLSEPTLSTSGIITWLQSAEAEVMSVSALVKDMGVKFEHAAQIEVEDRKAAEEATRRHTEAIEENSQALEKQETIKKTAEEKALRSFKMAVEGRLYRTTPYETEGMQKRATSDIQQLNGYKQKLEELYRQGKITQQQMQEIEAQYDKTIRHMQELGANNIEILPSILSEPESTSDLLNAMADSLDRERKNVERAADALVSARKGLGQAYSGDVYHGSKAPLDDVQYDPSKGTGWRNLGLGLYVTPDLELAATYGENIVKKTVALKNVFMLTEDFVTNIDDLYAAMGAKKPDNASWDDLTAALSASLNTKSQIKNFTKRMRQMGYDGMYSKGYGFGDKSAEQLVIYDENYWKDLTTTPAAILKALEQFDQADTADAYSKYGKEFATKYNAIFQGIREKIASGLIGYDDACIELANESNRLWYETKSSIENTTKTVRKLSNAQRAKMFDGASIKKLLEDYHVAKDDRDKIYDALDTLGSDIASNADLESIAEQRDNIVSLVLKSARQEVETGLESVFEDLKSGKIYYDSREIGEVGKNTFADVKSALSSHKLLTQSREKGLRADEYFHALSDFTQSMIRNAFEQEYSVGFNESKASILQGIEALIRSAPSKYTGLPEDEQNYLRQEAVAIVGKVIDNVNNLLKAEEQVTAEISKQNEVRADGEKSGTKDGKKEIEPILAIAEESKRMIDLISSAAGKSAATKFLEGITDTTDLKARVTDYFNEVFKGDDWKFIEGKGKVPWSIKGDTYTAHLINNKKDTLDAVFQMNDGVLELQGNLTKLNGASIEPFNVTKAIEDATAKVQELKTQLGDTQYSGMSKLEESAQAIADADSLKAFNEQLKISQKEVKQIADDTKWVIDQQKQLDSKVRMYKYGNKTLDGNTAMAYSGEEVQGTLNEFVESIRSSLTGVVAGALTDGTKNAIRDNMRILENEIKIQQLQKYANTTMKDTELESARQAFEYALDVLESKAKRNNVFTQLSDDFDGLRARLTDPKNKDYIQDATGVGDFVDKLRVAKSKLNAEIASEQENRSQEQFLTNLLNLQERLYGAKKRYVELEASDTTKQSDLQAAERKSDELQRQYDTSVSLLKSAEDYNTVRQRELQLEQELRLVQEEAYEARQNMLQAAEDAEEARLAKQSKAEISLYDQEQLEIQNKQKANYEELIKLRKAYNEADYEWHKAELSGGDKEPYNRAMLSSMQDMKAILAETKLTTEQVAEINRIDNEHLQRKNQLLNDAAEARKKNIEELQTFSRWESDIKNVGMLSDETAQHINNLKDAINKIDDDTDVSKLVEDFRALKSEVKYETTQSKATKTRMSEIKDSLNAQKQELKALYGQLDLELDLGNTAPNAKEIEQSYNAATAAIEKCTKAVGEQSQEEVSAAMRMVEAAKATMQARQTAENNWWYGGNPPSGGGGGGNNPPIDDKIKQWYQSLNATIQQISKIESKMQSLMLKDNGTGAWAPLISSLENQKAELTQRVGAIAQEISAAFNDQFVLGNQVDLPFSNILSSIEGIDAAGTISSFFNDVRTQTVLGDQAIEKFVSNLQNAQNKTEEFSTAMRELIYSTMKSAEKTLSNLHKNGLVDSNNEQYETAIRTLFAYKKAIVEVSDESTGALTDPSTWTSDIVANFLMLSQALNKYVPNLEKAASKEAEYFAVKKQYANVADAQAYDKMASSMDKSASSTDKAKQTLQEYVDTFSNGRGIITGFTTDANGISKINFSMLDEGTGYLRTFTAEMGQFTSNIYTSETSMNSLTAGTTAATKALESMSQIMSRLNGYGFNAGNNEYVAELNTMMQELSTKWQALSSSKNPEDQRTLQNLAMQADALVKKLLGVEKAWLSVQDAINGGKAEQIGVVGKGEDAQTKMTQFVSDIAAKMPGCIVSVGQFNAETNQLTYTVETADGQLQTFIMTMTDLNGSVSTSLKDVKKMKTGFQELTSGLGGTIQRYGKMLFSTYRIISYIRKGFNEVLEIDTAMTELKKVTDETSTAYNKFLDSAYESAQRLGSTMKEVIQATSDFARLGYSLEDASVLAEAANVYMNVGDGIEDVGTASESIISTMKAFNIEAEDSMGIVDRFNEVKVTCLHIW